MKHAGPETLERLEPLLAKIRQAPGLQERKPGIFYRGARAFLHFHEDPAGLFADARLAEDFERFAVSTDAQQVELVRRIELALGAPDRR